MYFENDRNFYYQLLRLTIPLFLQQLLRVSVDTLNSIMLGSIDQIQMSAMSQANQIFFIYYAVCSGLSIGCCVLVSQYWGKKDVDSISTIIAHGLRTAFVFGLVVSILVIVFSNNIMYLYSSDLMIVECGAKYLRKIALMFVACGLSVMIFGASRGVEQVRIVLFTNIISYSVNIILDYILIFGKLGFKPMGIDGVAVGTIVARYIELFICAIFFFNHVEIPFSIGDLKKYDNKLRKALFDVSFPIVAHEVVWSLGTSSGAMITGQLGKSAVAGYNVTSVLYDLFATIGNGFIPACGVVLGMSLGKGEIEKAKRQANSILLIAFIMGVSIGIISYFVKDEFLKLYSLDNEAINYFRQFSNVLCFIWPFSCIEMVTMVAILRAGGDGKFGFYTDIVVMWLICIPLAWLCAFKFNVPAWIIVGIIKGIIVLEALAGFFRVFTYKWVRNLTHD